MAPTQGHRHEVARRPTHSISKDRERSRRSVQRGSSREEESKLNEKQLEAIKEVYLGAKKAKKRVTKPSEKFRFSFDWHHTEDTSQDTKPLYERPRDARLVFGRGSAMDRCGVHWSEKKREEMTERDWRIFGEDHNISYKGSRQNRAQPMRNWEESGLIPELLEAVQRVGYQKPSPIQMAAIPIGLQQRDVIGVAETGSGKTAAFVLPMLAYVSKLPRTTPDDGPHAVVMAPTRELVMQIATETEKFARFLGSNIRVVSIVGGHSIAEQSQKLHHGCEIVIATPGRLLDCLERRYAVLNQCQFVILDEADRMIDMGFEEQVRAVLDAMPSSNLKSETENPNSNLHRTTFMFSATMPPAVERIAQNYLSDPTIVTIGSAGQTNDLIVQTVLVLQEKEKFDKLRCLLNEIQRAAKKAIVFVNTQNRAETLTRDLDRNAYRVASLHGGKAQQEREATLQEFRNASSKFQFLVATDLAGRGIDVPDVAHVVNFDMPGTIKKYIHRIGRTGRAGKRGVATTLLTTGDFALFHDLMDVLVRSHSHVPPELARHCRNLQM